MTAQEQWLNLAVYQIKINLTGSKPPIWRRVHVRGDTSLAKLHMILQVTMGWEDCHLHQFVVNNEYYGVPDPDFEFFGFGVVKDEKKVKLGQIVPMEKARFTYEYDF